MKVKVCGMSSIEQLEQLDDLGVEFAGLIFYEKSARFVGEKLRSYKSLITNLQLKRIGVFVNEDVERIEELVNEYKLDYVQLHGDESVFFCKEVEAFVPVIKAIRIDGETKLEECCYNYQDACTYFLFDTKSPSLTLPEGKVKANVQGQLAQEILYTRKESETGGDVCVGEASPFVRGLEGAYGGTGKKFDWGILINAKISKPFFLSGGIELEDVNELKKFNLPQLFAVDINSRFEIEPGLKDVSKIEEFLNRLK